MMETYRNFATTGIAAAMLLVGMSAAHASVVLTTATGSMSASSASEKSSAGTPQRASWDLATMKGVRSAAPPQPIVVTLEKVSMQDFHYICPSKTAARAAGGGVSAADDWQAPVCKAASATVQDGGKSYELSDVSFVSRPAAGCDGACTGTQVDVDVSFMAINEKGLPGTKTGTKNSSK
jgi:hypothetical protein